MTPFLKMTSALSLFLASAVLAVGSVFVVTGPTTAAQTDPVAVKSDISAPSELAADATDWVAPRDTSTIRRVGPRFYADPEKALDFDGRD